MSTVTWTEVENIPEKTRDRNARLLAALTDILPMSFNERGDCICRVKDQRAEEPNEYALGVEAGRIAEVLWKYNRAEELKSAGEPEMGIRPNLGSLDAAWKNASDIRRRLTPGAGTELQALVARDRFEALPNAAEDLLNLLPELQSHLGALIDERVTSLAPDPASPRQR